MALSVLITGANVHDKWMVAKALDAVVLRTSRGPRRPKNLCLDKGYDYADVEAALSARRIVPHIRRRGEPPMTGCVRGKPRRWVVERTNSWHNRFRGLLIRWERIAENYLAMLQLASEILAFQAARFWDVLLFSRQSKRWVVSVKHRIHSGRSVRHSDEWDPGGKVRKFQADGFMAFYSTVPSSALATTLKMVALEFDVEVFDRGRIEGTLLSARSLLPVIKQHLPESYQRIRRDRQDDLQGWLKLCADAGFDVSQETLSHLAALEISRPDSSGSFRISDAGTERLIVVCFIGERVMKGDFTVFDYFASIDRTIWEPLVALLKTVPVKEDALEEAIAGATDTLKARILVHLAGELAITHCTKAICQHVLFMGHHHDRLMVEHGLMARPFSEIALGALSSMPSAAKPVIEQYMELAAKRKRWQAKRLFEKAPQAPE